MTGNIKTILILGAGRSSSSLIKYLLEHSEKQQWKVRIADASIELARQKAQGHSNAEVLGMDIHDELQREKEIQSADVVISMMPPAFHFIVAQTCLEFSKPLFTASYVSPEIASVHQKAVKKNMLILMENGLDPGIDHMSAMKEIEAIQAKGGKLISFKSFTGGLVAPESDDNPWHYKITWNPRNVVLAGKGISKYLEAGSLKELNYQDLFTHLEKITVEGYGAFEGYANRDSLKYLETYRLQHIETFLRGTLRRPGFASAWNVLVQIGYTDDSYRIKNSIDITYKEFMSLLLKANNDRDIEWKLKKFGSEEDVEKIKWLGLLDEKAIGIAEASPADVLQRVLEEKLKLEEGAKDMIVMQHQFEYVHDNKKKKLTSSLVVKGENEIYTAMAKTVGLPLGIAAKLFLLGKLKMVGVHIPVAKEIYEPMLLELEELGIKFFNKEVDL